MKSREWKKANPERYWAQTTIDNHKRRGKPILATLDNITELRKDTTICRYCKRELVVELNGNHDHSPQSPSLDRVDVTKPYDLSNLQIICHECNSTKGIKDDAALKEYIKLLYKEFVKE
jgi:5-methylcytosine-specific restriction endonuclease McrA